MCQFIFASSLGSIYTQVVYPVVRRKVENANELLRTSINLKTPHLTPCTSWLAHHYTTPANHDRLSSHVPVSSSRAHLHHDSGVMGVSDTGLCSFRTVLVWVRYEW
ncbi:hypothetical protein SCLCIDRAFT_1217497 [Scleroderma citrinum Foug A]|uniref:Uncharacterized protein n=1 Tax=Scleroderma citrinum Foug A TaxID=1036808 RepID=A0A0C3DU54_9AGAM|nr:hypothetical protein SCLCIDRAFT_1217497 [Scleroderma citrinum Foug A]